MTNPLPVIGHTLLGALLGGLSRLPFALLYALSDLMFVIVAYIVRYRRRIITRNLQLCFPEKTPAEIAAVRRRFYRNLTDYFVETVKLAHVSDSAIMSRFTITGADHVDRLLDSGRSIVAYFSHVFNWEWAPSVTLWSHAASTPGVEFCQVYRPLKNAWFDSYFLKLRGRFGSVSLSKRTVLRDLLRMRSRGTVSITGFMSDQKPSHGDPTDIVMFLNRPTAMITGTETLARKLDMAVVYFDMRKISRGRYHLEIVPVAETLSGTEPYSLTERYAQLLQQTITRDPALWLWSHNRWKNPVTMPDA